MAANQGNAFADVNNLINNPISQLGMRQATN